MLPFAAFAFKLVEQRQAFAVRVHEHQAAVGRLPARDVHGKVLHHGAVFEKTQLAIRSSALVFLVVEFKTQVGQLIRSGHVCRRLESGVRDFQGKLGSPKPLPESFFVGPLSRSI